MASFYLAYNQSEETRKQTNAIFEQIKEMKLQTNIFLKSQEPEISFTAETRWSVEDVGVYIRNSGSETAIIKQLTLYIKDKTYDALNKDSFKDALDAMGLYSSAEGIPTWNCFGKDYHLHQGIFENLIVMRNIKRDEATFKKFSNAISSLIIKIKYESLQGKKSEKYFIASDFFH